MTIKEALFAELKTIPKFAGHIEEEDIFLEYRPETSTDFSDKSRNLSLVFYRVDGDEGGTVRNASQLFQLDVWGAQERHAAIETAKDILKDHFSQFKGDLGSSGIIIHKCVIAYEGDKRDAVTGEFCSYLRIEFHYIRATAGTIA